MAKYVMVFVLLSLLSACEVRESYGYVCTVDRVEGTFMTNRINLKTKSRMITMHRTTNGVERTFMFPGERVQCMERDDG